MIGAMGWQGALYPQVSRYTGGRPDEEQRRDGSEREGDSAGEMTDSRWWGRCRTGSRMGQEPKRQETPGGPYGSGSGTRLVDGILPDKDPRRCADEAAVMELTKISCLLRCLGPWPSS